MSPYTPTRHRDLHADTPLHETMRMRAREAATSSKPNAHARGGVVYCRVGVLISLAAAAFFFDAWPIGVCMAILAAEVRR